MKTKFLIFCSGLIFSLFLALNVQGSMFTESFISKELAIMAKATFNTQSTGCDTRAQHYCYPGDTRGADWCRWGPEVGIKCNPFGSYELYMAN